MEFENINKYKNYEDVIEIPLNDVFTLKVPVNNIDLLNSLNSLSVTLTIDDISIIPQEKPMILNECKEVVSYEYPKGTTIGEIADGKAVGIETKSNESKLHLKGQIIDIKEIPPYSINKFTKDIMFGYFVTIQADNLNITCEYPLNLFKVLPSVKFKNIQEEKLNLKNGDFVQADISVIGKLY